MSVALVVYLPRSGLSRADERQSGCQLQVREHLLHVVLHADAVLYEHHECVVMKQRWQQALQQVVVDGLQSYEHHVALRHVLYIIIYIRVLKTERTVAGVHLQSVGLDVVVVAMEQEVHLLSVVGELGSVVAADGSCAYNCIFHGRSLSFSLSVVLPERVCEKFDFHLWGDAFVEDVVNSVEDGHVHVHAPVYFLHALRAEVPLGNHFHLYLCTLHAVSLSNHRAEGAVAREVGVGRHELVAHVDRVHDVSLHRVDGVEKTVHLLYGICQ